MRANKCTSYAPTHVEEEVRVLGLEGNGEAVDDAAKDLKQLSNAIVVLRL